MSSPAAFDRNAHPEWVPALLNSYSQVLFAQDRLLAICLMLVTFLNPWSGVCGVFVTLSVILLGSILGIDKGFIQSGGLGFNALLLGLFLGSRFEMSFSMAFLLPVSAILVILFISSLGTWLGKYQLPVLSFPFLISSWLIELAAKQIPALTYASSSGNRWSFTWQVAHVLDFVPVPAPVLAYFETLSGAFFQQGVLGGVIIGIALWRVSRIMVSLTVIGFATTYAISQIPGLDCIPVCTDAGPNAVFLALAVGGHYLVAGPGAYLALIALIPILLLLVKGTEPLFSALGLHGYTLSFSLLTIIFLSFLYHRRNTPWLELVGIHHGSPETTLYKHISATERFRNAGFAALSLPFWGTWKVSQGYHGGITHIGAYAEALDFVITDEAGNTWAPPGKECTEFYCYDKPVIAPMAGYVHAVTDHTDDNPIGEVDTQQNWGNTVIINHQNGLFSQLSHLRKGSIKVAAGAYVEKGTVLGMCGNSGRSPEPHIHFQVQQSGITGAPAMPYPIACYIEHTEKGRILRTFDVPVEGTTVSNLEPEPALREAFKLSPGKTLRFARPGEPEHVITWEVRTDALNRTYLWCRKTNSTVWFNNDGNMFYCYDFEGDTESLLYHFYLAAYRVLLGYYPEIPIQDEYPLSAGFRYSFRWIQDIIAPFYRFAHARYESRQVRIEDQFHIQGKTSLIRAGKLVMCREHILVIGEKQIAGITCISEGQRKEYVCIG